MEHPFRRREACVSKMDGAVPSTSNGAAESDWVTAERYIHVVDATSAMDLPIRLASYPFAAEETKFGETVLSLEVIFVAVAHMVPSALNGNANASVLAVRVVAITGILTSPYL